MASFPRRARPAVHRRRSAWALALSAALLLSLWVTGVGSTQTTTPGLRWQLTPQPTWYWQLQGELNTHIDAEIDDVDGFDTSAAQVAALHAQGKHVICYIDVGTWESWRPDARDFPKSVLGRPDDWPGERWLDTRRLSILEPIMTRRMQMCALKGFDAVERSVQPLHPRAQAGARRRI